MADHAEPIRKPAPPGAAAKRPAAPASRHGELLSRRSEARLGPARSLLDRRAEAAASGPAPVQPANRTGLPDRLKQGIEALSGLSLDDVRVHRNSPRPAQLRALAFTRGSEIHIGPGAERTRRQQQLSASSSSMT